MVPVDSGGFGLTPPSLAIGASGLPAIAWLAPNAGDGTGGLLLSEASGPTGPFTTATVDTDGTPHCALRIDPGTGSPRVGYWAFVESDESADYFLRYASREGSSWLFSTLAVFLSAFPRGVSLELDGQGNPYVATTMFSPIAPQRTPGDGTLGSCGYVETGRFVVWSREGGHNTLGFTERAQLGDGTTTDAIGNRRSLASSAPGEVRGVWREPAQSATVCAPFAALTAELQRTVDVGAGPTPGVAFSLLCPNPLPAGWPVRVSLSLLRALARRFRSTAAGPGPRRCVPGARAPAARSTPRAGLCYSAARSRCRISSIGAGARQPAREPRGASR